MSSNKSQPHYLDRNNLLAAQSGFGSSTINIWSRSLDQRWFFTGQYRGVDIEGEVLEVYDSFLSEMNCSYS